MYFKDRLRRVRCVSRITCITDIINITARNMMHTGGRWCVGLEVELGAGVPRAVCGCVVTSDVIRFVVDDVHLQKHLANVDDNSQCNADVSAFVGAQRLS